MTKAAPKTVSASDIRAGLQRHYPQPRYAVLFEVTDATGARHTRSADALIMSCWPSNGLDLTGMEIKVFRQDWIRELRRPEKAETIAAYCDRWTLVTGPGVVADLSEIPPAWGWMVFDGKRFTMQREAQKNLEPKPVNRLFLAALLRRVAKTDDGMLEALVAERMQSLREKNDEEILRRINQRSQDFVALQKMVAEFEEATGFKLTDESVRGWFRSEDGKTLGRLVKALNESGLAKGWGGLNSLEDQLKRTLGQIDKVRELTGMERPAPEAALENHLGKRRAA